MCLGDPHTLFVWYNTFKSMAIIHIIMIVIDIKLTHVLDFEDLVKIGCTVLASECLQWLYSLKAHRITQVE